MIYAVILLALSGVVTVIYAEQNSRTSPDGLHR